MLKKTFLSLLCIISTLISAHNQLGLQNIIVHSPPEYHLDYHRNIPMLIYALGILEKDDKILFLFRKNAKFFSNHYGLMGGKIEENESPYTALIREAHEELGIVIAQKSLQFAHCISFKNEIGHDVLALVFKIDSWNGEISNNEPEKCDHLAWFSLHDLPENIIPRHRLIIEKINAGIAYNEVGW